MSVCQCLITLCMWICIAYIKRGGCYGYCSSGDHGSHHHGVVLFPTRALVLHPLTKAKRLSRKGNSAHRKSYFCSYHLRHAKLDVVDAYGGDLSFKVPSCKERKDTFFPLNPFIPLPLTTCVGLLAI